MTVAVIPARGGSKRIPRKNIKPFCGKPMIAWSIEAALASGCFDKVIVSTDDDEIAAVAQAHGAWVPFKRPVNLSDDYTGTTDVIKHAAQWLAAAGYENNYLCCLYATAPFIRAEDLRRGKGVMDASNPDYVFSATTYAFPIQRALKVDEQGLVSMFQPEHFATRSQDLTEAWHDAGQFYWGTRAAWLEKRPIFSSSARLIELPRHRVQDIDTPEDWARAEWLFKAMQAGQ
ncbi:pseudaminic acid cytidylyltransferase [Idiomarina ramblicola]|uniref:Pseudaminic acid cytidylyltransferase n=1 Tax=Idiomarina ramblicola TaxID=263724 RepID=A0A432Z1N9_9GAMM|nr:pseudaminic acid cytidylyltransferase [Idiomarina ramblicola]RUO71787.1 pseudaminic acid cytidylyltransferase [Idiomarina ramblicola]